jgi:hypothetical protein
VWNSARREDELAATERDLALGQEQRELSFEEQEALVVSFTHARPRVELELEQLDPPAALGQLRAGELDLAVIYRFEPGDPADDPEARLSSSERSVQTTARAQCMDREAVTVLPLLPIAHCSSARCSGAGSAATCPLQEQRTRR